MTFQVHALSYQQFNHLFQLTDAELRANKAIRQRADSKPGFPCRVSLKDAEIGENVILLNFQHQSADSPFQSTHAIYIRESAVQAQPEIGTIPESIATRFISVRAFNENNMMISADAVEGTTLHNTINQAFRIPDVSYLHLHYAKQGCFAATVTRIEKEDNPG